jgi:rhodanese-related sulfurtransferase
MSMEICCQVVHTKLAEGEDFLLLDCREQEEWDYCHIDGAMLVPMSQLQSRVSEVEPFRDSQIIVYCHHGVRSLRVAMWLQQQGFKHAASMSGGIEDWSLNIDPNIPRY